MIPSFHISSMDSGPLHWARLVHERLAVVAMFAYSHAALAELRKQLPGERKFLDKVIYDIPKETATQALVDFALYFRALDDQQGLSDVWKLHQHPPTVGLLVMKEGETKPLSPRKMSNTVIHAERIDWNLSSDPKVTCVGRDKEKWSRSEIEIKLLLAVGGHLGS